MIRAIHYSVVATLVALVTVPAFGQPRPRDEEIITNYWSHLSRVLEKEAAAEALPPPGPGVRFPPPRQYAFDAIQHLNTSELRRAAMEGIKAAEKSLAGEPKAIIDEQVEANILLALQYYPLAATREEDFRQLMVIIEDGSKNPIYRRILMSRLIPGLRPVSLLSDYLQSNLVRDRDEISKMIGKIATSPVEHPEIQILAMEVLYTLQYNEYVQVLNSDANIRALKEETGKTLSPMGMAQPDAPELTKAVALRFNGMTSGFEGMARMLAENLDPIRNHTDAVKDTVHAIINRILSEVPLANPDVVKQLITTPKTG